MGLVEANRFDLALDDNGGQPATTARMRRWTVVL